MENSNQLKQKAGLAAVLRGAGMFIHSVLAGGLTFLAVFGPLNASMIAAAAVAAAVFLAVGGLWYGRWLTARNGEREAARRQSAWLIGVPLAVALAFGVTALVQSYQLGAFQPRSSSRVENLQRLCRAVEKNYVYYDTQGAEWQAACAQAQEAAPDLDENAYRALVGNLMAVLNDSHTNLSWASQPNECKFVILEEVEGQAVVTLSGSAAQSAGLVDGSLIQAVDGMTLDEAIQALEPRLRSGSTPWQARRAGMENLLTTPYGGTRQVEFETPDGVRRSAALTCPPPQTVPASTSQQNSGPVVESLRLEDDLGYIFVPSMDLALVDDFDAALDALMDTRGLILDLRGNGGGNSLAGDAIAGRLLSNNFAYGIESYRTLLPNHLWQHDAVYIVQPRKMTYSAPVVVLIDGSVMSSTEMLLAALVDSGRVTTVGRTTAGGSGNPVSFNLGEGISVRFSTGDFRRLDGTPIEGVGFEPDVPVSWTLEDLRSGRDPDLEQAQRVLLKLIPAE